MKVERNSGALPKWLNDLAECMRGDKQKKVAVKNVQNLPKVNWKDETFYVDFTKQGAVLYNSFGNEVQLVDGATSVDEVNRYMNENSVVASLDGNDSTDSQDSVDEAMTKQANETDDAFELELKKIADTIDNEKEIEVVDEHPMDEPTVDDNEPSTDEVKIVEDEIDNEKEIEVVDEHPMDEPTVDDNEPSTDEVKIVEDEIEPTDTVVGEDCIPQSSEDLTGEPSQSVDDVCDAPAQEIMYRDNALTTVGENASDKSIPCVGDTIYVGGHPCTFEGVTTIPAGTKVHVVDLPVEETVEELPEEEVTEKVVAEDENTNSNDSSESSTEDTQTTDSSTDTNTSDSSEFVSKASYNRLLSIVKNLERKIAKMEGNKMSKNTKGFSRKNKRNKLVAFTEAQHAYTTIPNDAYDLNSQDLEVQHFVDSAELSKFIIDKEHELDLSNMRDRAKLNDYFLKDLLSVYEDLGDVIDEAVSPTDDVVIDDVIEEPSEQVVVIPSETIEEVNPECDDEYCDVVLIDDDKMLDEFAEQNCPMCHAHKSLKGMRKVAGVIGVSCSKCGKEYAVSANNKVYAKK